MLSGAEAVLDVTRPAISRVAYFLFAADSRFTAERPLPLFGEDETAFTVWEPYLHNPRYDDRMLDVGFRESVVAQ